MLLECLKVICHIYITIKVTLLLLLLLLQGGHKPGTLSDFSEHGKLWEFSRNSVQPQGKIVTKYF